MCPTLSRLFVNSSLWKGKEVRWPSCLQTRFFFRGRKGLRLTAYSNNPPTFLYLRLTWGEGCCTSALTAPRCTTEFMISWKHVLLPGHFFTKTKVAGDLFHRNSIRLVRMTWIMQNGNCCGVLWKRRSGSDDPTSGFPCSMGHERRKWKFLHCGHTQNRHLISSLWIWMDFGLCFLFGWCTQVENILERGNLEVEEGGRVAMIVEETSQSYYWVGRAGCFYRISFFTAFFFIPFLPSRLSAYLSKYCTCYDHTWMTHLTGLDWLHGVKHPVFWECQSVKCTYVCDSKPLSRSSDIHYVHKHIVGKKGPGWMWSTTSRVSRTMKRKLRNIIQSQPSLVSI